MEKQILNDTGSFVSSLEKSQESFSELLNDLKSSLAGIRNSQREEMGWLNKKITTLTTQITSPETSPDIMLPILDYTRRNLTVKSAMPVEFKGLYETINFIKREATKVVASTPKDLSRVYMKLRNKHDILYGDLATDCVDMIYKVQPQKENSLVTQLVYARALIDTMFPNVTRGSSVYALFNGTDVKKKKRKVSKKHKIIRMLRDDLDMMVYSQILNDYRNTAEEIIALKHNKHLARNMLLDTMFTKGLLAKAVVMSNVDITTEIPVIIHINKALDFVLNNGTDIMKEHIFEHLPEHELFALIVIMIMLDSMRDSYVNLIFDNETISNINKMPDIDWNEVHLAREIASSQKVVFEDSTYPIFASIDPVPNKTYVAAVAIQDLEKFKNLDKKYGSQEAALEMFNPLTKPVYNPGVNEIIYHSDQQSVFATESLAFYVRGSDGELCVYGDSTGLAQAMLGDKYDMCKKMIHNLLYDFVQSDYVDGNGAQTTDDIDDAEPIDVDEPHNNNERELPSNTKDEDVNIDDIFYGRVAHSRLLPVDWTPSFTGWQNAKDSDGVDLYAIVITTDNKPTGESIKLDLSEEFKDFRRHLHDLRVQYSGLIRFQTYVSESKNNTDTQS